MPDVSRQDQLYREAVGTYEAALKRVARGFEPDPDRCRDLLQDIHLALWQSFARFDGRCSLRTWVYRVAQNVATSQVLRRRTPALVGIDEILETGHADDVGHDEAIDRERALERLRTLIDRLKPIDRQVILLYLEGLDAAAIGEITGLSAGNVATKTHRIRKILVNRFHQEARHAG